MTRTLEFLSSFALGLIPFLDTTTSPLPVAYARYAARGRLKTAAINLLFLSGNTPVDVEGVFSTAANLKKFIATKNYRGLLALQGISVEIPAEGPMRLRFSNPLTPTQEIGYTPYRARLFDHHTVLYHSPGEGVRRPPVILSDGNSVFLSHQVSFRVGWIARAAGRLLTGSWAPFAWMRVEYLIQRNGKYRITWAGSCVPTQTWLAAALYGERICIQCNAETLDLDLQAQSQPRIAHSWDMLGNAPDDVEAFIDARNPSGDEAYSITIARRDEALTIGDNDAGS